MILFYKVGWALIAMALVLTTYALFPVRVSDPTWQLKATMAIIGNIEYLLVGSVFVCFGSREASIDSAVIKRAQLLRTVSAWFSLLLFVMIPLQLMASLQVVNNQYSAGTAALRRMSETISKLEKTSSEEELRSILQNLPNPPQLPEKFSVPFEKVKKSILDASTYNLKLTENQLRAAKDSGIQIGVAESSRNGVFLFFSALGFAWIGVSDPNHYTVMATILSMFDKRRSKGLWR